MIGKVINLEKEREWRECASMLLDAIRSTNTVVDRLVEGMSLGFELDRLIDSTRWLDEMVKEARSCP